MTELPKTLALARGSETVFRLLVDTVQDYAIFMLDPTGLILTWNRGAERLKGYTVKDVVGSHFSRFYTPEDMKRGHPTFELKQAASTGKYEEEGWRIRKDGTRFWANVVITAIRDESGVLLGFGKVTRDLSERKIAEDKLRDAYASLELRVQERTAELSKARDEAERAVKMRDEFLSIASHELKTPLTSLQLQTEIRRMNLEAGRTEAFAPAQMAKLIASDERQVTRLIQLVEDMLDVSRLAMGKLSLSKELFDLNALTHEVVERFAPQLHSKGIHVDIHEAPTAQGRWDRFRIDQVLTNLVSNAIKYGGEKSIRIDLSATDVEARVVVRDEGIGIAQADQARIFDQFERTNELKGIGGLGLGLYIARQIVDEHGGRLRVESQLGKGSSFIVDLPKLAGNA